MEGILGLFTETEIFIFVFMEIVVRIKPIQQVIFKKSDWRDKAIFIVVFGGFSILGTYVGIPLASGAIVNIRDFAPMVAGVVAGPIIGSAVGLIGGVHRLLIGGFTCIPCGLATVFAGAIGGAVYYFNKGRLIGILPAVLLAIGVEILHGGLTLLIARPFAEALEVVKIAIPAMMVANGLGMAIAIIILDHTKELKEIVPTSKSTTSKGASK
jgi:sigma-B regulation protein RsbU (phosphoserine phosphatase)